MPFSEATVLVTVEREGILAASVFPLSGKDPVIRVPIRDYAPNVFVSVLAVRGRIDSVQPTAMVDLGKPAFKLGIVEIKVGWRDHELKVAVTSDRDGLSRAREGARENRGQNRQWRPRLPPGAEVAVAAVDQGLLELSPNDKLEAARRDDGRAPLRDRNLNRADAGRRQTPLRPQGNSARRWRRAANHPPTVQHPAAVEGRGYARRARRGGGRSAAERFAHQLQDRRGRQRRRRSVRHRRQPVSGRLRT